MISEQLIRLREEDIDGLAPRNEVLSGWDYYLDDRVRCGMVLGERFIAEVEGHRGTYHTVVAVSGVSVGPQREGAIAVTSSCSCGPTVTPDTATTVW